jgi:hypothetical protein
MAKQFDAATDMGLRANAAFKKGKVPARALNAVLDSIKDAMGVERGGLFGTPKEYPLSAVATSTAAVAKASAARVYGVRAVSGTAAGGSAASNDVIVHVLDDTVIIGTLKLTKNEDGEAYFYGKDGIGVLALTNVKVKAVQVADGSSNPAAADRPAVTVLAS